MNRIVAIVGRPNVGKSTLFNRLTEKGTAIVDEVSGVTRDRHYGKTIWNNTSFSVIDTGGFVNESDDMFEGEINRQVLLAIEEADLILFMTDVTTGITEPDRSVAEMLRRSDKEVLVIVNKVDNNQRLLEAGEFYALGMGDYFPISSINGSGTGDLLDRVVELLPEGEEDSDTELPRLAIVGRPNTGKSSLINSLLGEERFIVTPVAGTTRDSIYTRYKKYDHDFMIVDTAGLRKRGKVHDNIEFYSTLRSVRAIENSDVCLLLLDATRGIESQDLYIMNLILTNNKGIVVLVNKWDLVEKETNTMKMFEKVIRERTAPFTDYPMLFISATNKQRIHKVLETAMEVFRNRTQKIPTPVLNNYMQEIIKATPPPANKGKYIKIKYVTQLPTHSPSFAFFCNLPQYVKDPYKRFIENRLRDKFNLSGVPIRVFFRKK